MKKIHDAKHFRKRNAHRSACTYTENLGRGFPTMRSLTLLKLVGTGLK
jgi:hypothetical protein